MAFIRTIPPAEAHGPVREQYQQAQKRFGYVPNWAQAFSLQAGSAGRLDRAAPLHSGQSAGAAELRARHASGRPRALRSSYCALAHGSVLADKVFGRGDGSLDRHGRPGSPLEPGERVMMAFAEKVARSADQVSADDVEGAAISRIQGRGDLRRGAAVAAARCFFSKLLDAMGVQPDSSFQWSRPDSAASAHRRESDR